MREQILSGILPCPIVTLIEENPTFESKILTYWKSLWVNFLAGNEVNGLIWYDELGYTLYNQLVRTLCSHGWITSDSRTGRKWASAQLSKDKLLEFVTEDELVSVITAKKYTKYTLECEEARASTLVKQNGITKRTGLIRKGFRDAGNTQFGYDMAKLSEYEEAVKKNIVKSMDKVRDVYPEMQNQDFSYDNVAVGIFEWHKDNAHEVFTTGDNINDSRGRAISQCLKKVFNPISSKDARASLIITYEEE